MLVLKIACVEWHNESRDKRELDVCRELGASVCVLAKGNVGERGAEDSVDGFRVYRYTTRPVRFFPTKINRFISIFAWASFARKLGADVISGHDITGLFIGWLSNLGGHKKAKLVYDSHEFELGRDGKQGKARRLFIRLLEGFLIKKCAFTIMVSDSIASAEKSLYGQNYKIVVVRSTPNNWELDEQIEAVRTRIIHEMNWPDDAFIIMYHGIIAKSRSIETSIKAIERNPNIFGIIVGNDIHGTLASELKEYCEAKGFANRVFFHEAIPIEKLYQYVGAANVGMILFNARCESYRLALPNKFFENVQALTPLITAYYPEMKSLIDEYQIGITVDPTDESEIDSAIEKMRVDESFYKQLKTNLIKAKDELCWDKEKEKLVAAYSELL